LEHRLALAVVNAADAQSWLLGGLIEIRGAQPVGAGWGFSARIDVDAELALARRPR
jgi:hypothetical protein